jgi:uncharacterized protein YciI
MNFKVDNLCKRSYGWEGYLYCIDDKEISPIEFRFQQEKQPTQDQIDNVIKYHIERIDNIRLQESLIVEGPIDDPIITPKEKPIEETTEEELVAEKESLEKRLSDITTAISVKVKPIDPIKEEPIEEVIKVGK